MTLSPQFRLIGEQSPYRSFAEALAALFETEPPVCPLRLGSGGPWPRDRRPVPAFVASILLHVACAFFLYNVPLAWLVRRISGYPIPPEPEHHYSVVIYHLQSSNLADYLPLDLSPGTGGTPGRGAPRLGKAMRGSSRLDPRVSIVSNPKTPDNFHQTILQPSLPPNLRITQDFPLPDLVIKSSLPAIEPPMPPPPPKASAIIQPPIMPAISNRLPVRPTSRLIVPALADLVPPLVQSPALPTPLPPPQPDQPAPAVKQTVATATSPPGELLSLSVNPTLLKALLILPAGNREGAFSISSAGNQEGSPGGTTSGNQKAGTAGGGSAGDLSINRGPGISGGTGGSGPSGSATASISGGPEGSRALSAGSLTPLNAEALVYPVDSRLRLRGAALVVSTGPGGGGGLDVYGILHGQRIYTVYLVMAPRNWILQFCVPEADPPSEHPARLVRLQLEPPLTPPTAVDKFDFRRPALLGDKARGMIILHGLIEKNGVVAKLRIVRGVEALADQAALAALARWKFSPALRGGTPVAVEILVGIPARP